MSGTVPPGPYFVILLGPDDAEMESEVFDTYELAREWADAQDDSKWTDAIFVMAYRS